MRLVTRIVLFGTAMAAAAAMLGGCGGGSDGATHRLQALEHYRCEVIGVERQLQALEAGISATKREFEGTNSGPARQQILRSMEENARSIQRQLPTLEGCAQDALGGAERKPARERSLPPARTVVGYRVGPPRIEPGEQSLPASPCSAYGKNGTTTLYIHPDSPGCAVVHPGERLQVANLTGEGSSARAVSVRVRVGDYELWLGPHDKGLIPAPVQTYLGRGTHSAHTVGGLGPTILLLPRVCAIRPPAKPGEELCFRR